MAEPPAAARSRIKLTLSRKALLIVCLPLLFQVLLVAAFHAMKQRYDEDNRWHLHSQEVMADADVILRLLTEVEAASFRPDLVLMDIVLPGISGYDLARYVRQDERYAALPIVFLTTEVQMQARIETARAGGDGYIEKPVTPGLLLSDVAARIERARFIKGLMNRDGLTRLLTHTAFLERARAALAQARRDPNRSLAWAMIDVDHFKAINDQYGHPVGDRVLAGLSALLRRRLRQPDTIGRYGGEEFALLIEGLREPEAVRLVTRLLADFAATDHHAADGAPFRATFSAGVAALAPETMDLERWRKAADDALYRAKAAGRNRVVAAGEAVASGAKAG